ncbi:ATP-binding protein [bacterium]|nr:ATP-binding protein [bacterium]
MSRNGYHKLRKYILLSMILAPAIIYVLALGIGYFYFAESLRNSTLETMKRLVKDHRQSIESFLDERRGDLSFMMDVYTFEDLKNPAQLQKALKQLQRKSGAFVDLGVFDNTGVHAGYQGPYDLTGRNYKDESWFKEVMEKGVYVSDVFRGFRNVPHFVIAIVNRTGAKSWIIRSTIDSQMFNSLVEHVSIGKTGEAYILNSRGVLQTRSRAGGDRIELSVEAAEPAFYHEGIRIFEQTGANDALYLTATTWLNERSWMLVVRQEKTDAFQALNSATIIIAVITAIGILIIILASVILSAGIVRRMEQMDLEKEKLRFQLIRASGLAELGELATGFAHEINNPLQIIKNEKSLIEMNLKEQQDAGLTEKNRTMEEVTDSLNQINLQVERCAKITQAILKFGRASNFESTNINLVEFISQITSMVEKRAGVHGISFIQELPEGLKPIVGDPAQLQQVFLNLINNAVDAVIEKHGASGGSIKLSVSQDDTGKTSVLIWDNGVGISQENLGKLFTPFFTTKPVGKGTGLGLAVCYGIVNKMGGTMDVTSTSAAGTTFTVNFPLTVG